ncbi:MAG: hypothetical protein Q4E22_05665 [Coriobacteriia bacterium]|nr:hypothetical protein [Coriobacteriia bacterium]
MMKKKLLILSLSFATLFTISVPGTLATEANPQQAMVCDETEHKHDESCIEKSENLIDTMDEEKLEKQQDEHQDKNLEENPPLQEEKSLFNQLMDCENPEDAHALLDENPLELLKSLTAEERAQVCAKFPIIAPAPPSTPLAPAPVYLEEKEKAPDSLEETASIEIICSTVNFDKVAPLVAPVEAK